MSIRTKKLAFHSIFVALFVVIALAGCAPVNAPTPPLAPGYQNAQDQTMGSVLAGARRFYVSIQTQAQAGTLVLKPEVKTAFNAFGVSLNAAESVYLAYHSGQATEAQAQGQVTIVQNQQAALPLPGAK